MIEAYPLAWPEGFKRTKYPRGSRFEKRDLSISKTTKEVIYQLKLLGGTNAIISTNLRLKIDGLPYSQQKQPEDRGVAVWFTLNGNQRVLACDEWRTIEENLWAVAKTIDAMRGIDRWGVSDMLDRIFTGFLALPSKPHWKYILDLPEKCSFEDVKRSFLLKAKEFHPDRGGDPEKMAELNEAFESAKREFHAN
ncbi:J domain-containing protein [Leptospira perdikensis]|uniref:J domain-containing protein n=1 Tax=Leptospira perdikensis TaxID=2484948 RepID=A0A4R9JAR4_9LEPT|nr:J domain-containing protein [Leptospira perdikensis]TGL35575.1 J domain-containing protein [Leptospira perdikensis]